MSGFRKELTDLIRPQLVGGKLSKELVDAIDALLDRAGVPRDGEADAAPPTETASPSPPPKPPSSPAPPAPAATTSALPKGRLDLPGLRSFLGLPATGSFDAAARTAFLARLANPKAPALTEADFDAAAAALGVSPNHIRAVREVEVRESPFDPDGRPTILYERHVFTRNCNPKGKFNASNPAISGAAYGKGGYGAKSAQYGKLLDAMACDPEAALRACSWGAFQVLGENAVGIGYVSTLEMVTALTTSEAAHLESFLRFLKANKLIAKLAACRAGDPASCVPFVSAYNGAGYKQFGYHLKLADALK
jgi:hypothetical protein